MLRTLDRSVSIKARDCYLVTARECKRNPGRSARCPMTGDAFQAVGEAVCYPEETVECLDDNAASEFVSGALRSVGDHAGRDATSRAAATAARWSRRSPGDEADSQRRDPQAREDRRGLARSPSGPVALGRRSRRPLPRAVVARRRRHGRRVRRLRPAARSQGRAQAPAREPRRRTPRKRARGSSARRRRSRSSTTPTSSASTTSARPTTATSTSRWSSSRATR